MSTLVLVYSAIVAAHQAVKSGNAVEIMKHSNSLMLMNLGHVVETAREKIAAAKELEAKKLVWAFMAHVRVGNEGAMQSCLNKLRRAEYQIGLIRHLGGVESRDKFMLAAHNAWTKEVQIKAIMKKTRNKKNRKAVALA